MRSWKALTAKETASKVIGWLPHVVNCPADVEKLEDALSASSNYVLCDNDEVLGWMALNEKGICGFVIRTEHRKRWLTKDVMKSFASVAFRDDRPFVLFDTAEQEVLRLALRVGAKPVYDSGVKNCYCLTADNFFQGRLH